MKKSLVFLAILAAAGAAAAQTPAPASLQQACVNAVKPTLKGVERIRDIGGNNEQNVTFAISENGGKVRVVDCRVQADGKLKLINKGAVVKSS